MTGVALAVLFLAHPYEGWPGVAGWEYVGMQSPLVPCVPVAACVLLAAPAGLAMVGLLHLSDHLAARRIPARAARPDAT